MALREVIAILEFRILHNLDRGRMKRSTNCFVTLDGERMCLSDAARQLRLSEDALRWRIKSRLGAIVDTVDLRDLDLFTDRRRSGKKAPRPEARK